MLLALPCHACPAVLTGIGTCHRDYDADKEEWGWARAAPVSQKTGGDASSSPKNARRKACLDCQEHHCTAGSFCH